MIRDSCFPLVVKILSWNIHIKVRWLIKPTSGFKRPYNYIVSPLSFRHLDVSQVQALCWREGAQTFPALTSVRSSTVHPWAWTLGSSSTSSLKRPSLFFRTSSCCLPVPPWIIFWIWSPCHLPDCRFPQKPFTLSHLATEIPHVHIFFLLSLCLTSFLLQLSDSSSLLFG